MQALVTAVAMNTSILLECLHMPGGGDIVASASAAAASSPSSSSSASSSASPTSSYQTFHAFLHFCNHFVIPVVIVAGILGNILTFIVFVFSSLKRLSTSVFLAALALADLGFLCMLGAGWIDNFRFSFFQQQVVCTCIVYATYIFSFLSVWFVVCFTLEMYLTLFHEALASRVSQPYKARIVVCVLSFLCGMLYLHTFWTTKQVKTSDGRLTCSFVADESVRMAMALVDSFLTLVLPFTLLIFMNTRIFLVIVDFSRKKGHHPLSTLPSRTSAAITTTTSRKKATATVSAASRTELTTQAGLSPEPSGTENGNAVTSSSADDLRSDKRSGSQASLECKTSGGSRRGANGSCARNSSKDPWGVEHRRPIVEIFQLDEDLDLGKAKRKTMPGKINKMQRKSFKMLLTVTTVFLLLNLPSHAIRLQGLLRSFFTRNYATSEMEHLCQQLFQLFYYFNFVANFVIYNVCAKSFRTAFFTLPLIFSKQCQACTQTRKRRFSVGGMHAPRRMGQELRRQREEQNSRLVEVNFAELHLSKMESFAADYKYQSPPCLLRLSDSFNEQGATV